MKTHRTFLRIKPPWWEISEMSPRIQKWLLSTLSRRSLSWSRWRTSTWPRSRSSHSRLKSLTRPSMEASASESSLMSIQFLTKEKTLRERPTSKSSVNTPFNRVLILREPLETKGLPKPMPKTGIERWETTASTRSKSKCSKHSMSISTKSTARWASKINCNSYRRWTMILIAKSWLVKKQWECSKNSKRRVDSWARSSEEEVQVPRRQPQRNKPTSAVPSARAAPPDPSRRLATNFHLSFSKPKRLTWKNSRSD